MRRQATGASTNTMRMDEDFKRGFGAVCEELGDDIPTVVIRPVERMIRERRVPFEVSANLFYFACKSGAFEP